MSSKYKCYKWCFVPSCRSTTYSTPDKIFVSVPLNAKRRNAWILASRRDETHKKLSRTSSLFCCEDHFNMEEDMENFLRFRLMNGDVNLKSKKDAVPHIFAFRNSSTSTGKYISKRCNQDIIYEALTTPTDQIIDAIEDVESVYIKEEIKDELDDSMHFEECLVSGVPENYLENTDNSFSSEEISEGRTFVSTPPTDHGCRVRKSENVGEASNYFDHESEGQARPSSNDQAKDSLEIKSEPSHQELMALSNDEDWVATDESYSTFTAQPLAAKFPIEFTDSEDDESDFSSGAQAASAANVASSGNEKLMPMLTNQTAYFDKAVATLTCANKMWTVEHVDEITTLSMPSSMIRKRKIVDLEVNHSSENLFDDEGGDIAKTATKERCATEFEDETTLPSQLTTALPMNKSRSVDDNIDNINENMTTSRESQVKIVDSNSETDNSVNSCEEITHMLPNRKRPSIICESRFRGVNLSDKKLDISNKMISKSDKIWVVEEISFQTTKPAKTNKRKQVLVCKPDCVDESDVTMTDSDDETEIELTDSDDDVRVVFKDGEYDDEARLTDTDDETEILYDNYGSFITCNICYKTFDSQSVLTLHKKTHRGFQSFQCLECDVMFRTEFGLECHSCERSSLSFVCKECKSTFTSEWGAISHECAEDGQTQTRSGCKICGANLARSVIKHHMAEAHLDLFGQWQEAKDSLL